ncbi:MAG: beta/gamma crystallin-related protein [Verrucomicrobiota bacterium]
MYLDSTHGAKPDAAGLLKDYPPFPYETNDKIAKITPDTDKSVRWGGIHGADTGGQPINFPEVTIYSKPMYEGVHAHTHISYLKLGCFWQHNIASITIQTGIWEFYENEDHNTMVPGRSFRLRPGFFPELPEEPILSFKLISVT